MTGAGDTDRTLSAEHMAAGSKAAVPVSTCTSDSDGGLMTGPMTSELVGIEYLDGDIEEIDLETWHEIDLELTHEPEGWSESEEEEDEDEDEEEDEDEDWDEDEDDEDEDWDEDEEEDE